MKTRCPSGTFRFFESRTVRSFDAAASAHVEANCRRVFPICRQDPACASQIHGAHIREQCAPCFTPEIVVAALSLCRRSPSAGLSITFGKGGGLNRCGFGLLTGLGAERGSSGAGRRPPTGAVAQGMDHRHQTRRAAAILTYRRRSPPRRRSSAAENDNVAIKRRVFLTS
jgi:hypothetical protein